jgi:hypothetical protein
VKCAAKECFKKSNQKIVTKVLDYGQCRHGSFRFRVNATVEQYWGPKEPEVRTNAPWANPIIKVCRECDERKLSTYHCPTGLILSHISSIWQRATTPAPLPGGQPRLAPEEPPASPPPPPPASPTKPPPLPTAASPKLPTPAGECDDINSLYQGGKISRTNLPPSPQLSKSLAQPLPPSLQPSPPSPTESVSDDLHSARECENNSEEIRILFEYKGLPFERDYALSEEDTEDECMAKDGPTSSKRIKRRSVLDHSKTEVLTVSSDSEDDFISYKIRGPARESKYILLNNSDMIEMVI